MPALQANPATHNRTDQTLNQDLGTDPGRFKLVVENPTQPLNFERQAIHPPLASGFNYVSVTTTDKGTVVTLEASPDGSQSQLNRKLEFTLCGRLPENRRNGAEDKFISIMQATDENGKMDLARGSVGAISSLIEKLRLEGQFSTSDADVTRVACAHFKSIQGTIRECLDLPREHKAGRRSPVDRAVGLGVSGENLKVEGLDFGEISHLGQKYVFSGCEFKSCTFGLEKDRVEGRKKNAFQQQDLLNPDQPEFTFKDHQTGIVQGTHVDSHGIPRPGPVPVFTTSTCNFCDFRGARVDMSEMRVTSFARYGRELILNEFGEPIKRVLKFSDAINSFDSRGHASEVKQAREEFLRIMGGTVTDSNSRFFVNLGAASMSYEEAFAGQLMAFCARFNNNSGITGADLVRDETNRLYDDKKFALKHLRGMDLRSLGAKNRQGEFYEVVPVELREKFEREVMRLPLSAITGDFQKIANRMMWDDSTKFSSDPEMNRLIHRQLNWWVAVEIRPGRTGVDILSIQKRTQLPVPPTPGKRQHQIAPNDENQTFSIQPDKEEEQPTTTQRQVVVPEEEEKKPKAFIVQLDPRAEPDEDEE
jgi:hypothetical protein